MNLKYYTMTTMVDGELYYFQCRTEKTSVAIEKLIEHIQETDRDNDLEVDEYQTEGWVVSMVVTTEKPLRYGAY